MEASPWQYAGWYDSATTTVPTNGSGESGGKRDVLRTSHALFSLISTPNQRDWRNGWGPQEMSTWDKVIDSGPGVEGNTDKSRLSVLFLPGHCGPATDSFRSQNKRTRNPCRLLSPADIVCILGVVLMLGTLSEPATGLLCSHGV